MPQRDSCAKRACPASASQGAGLPYPPEKLRLGNRLERFDGDGDADHADGGGLLRRLPLAHSTLRLGDLTGVILAAISIAIRHRY
jgi:hypothetical protein